jgi:hypothetical protein
MRPFTYSCLIAISAVRLAAQSLGPDEIERDRQQWSRLADAIPEADYSRRLDKHSRPASEILLHAAGVNYYFASILGAKMPPDIRHRMDPALTDKARIRRILDDSFLTLRQAVASGGKPRGKRAALEEIFSSYRKEMRADLDRLAGFT